MADANANIKFTADTTQALASIKDLQRSISTMYRQMAKDASTAQSATAGMQQNLVNGINSTNQFTARLTTIRTTTESFTNALEKNKLSLGQYFRFGVASTKNFGKVFTTEFNTIEKVARERVKDLQTQYIKLGRDANGAMKAIAVRPTTLDMTNLGTQTAIAAQKQQIFNQLLKQGTTNLLNFGKNTQWAGRQLMVGFTIPLSIFATTASRSFMALEKQVIQFRRVYGDLFTTPEQTEMALTDMRKLAMEFTKLGVSVESTLELAAKVAQMGNTGQALTAQVTEATRLSVLGSMSQQDALDTTIGLTNAFGVSIEDLTGKVDFLNAAENQTILSIQDFNEAVPRAGSVVKQLGGDVEDLAFFLTAMREGGIEATQAANALKSSLGRLINPTEAARQRLRAMGIDILAIVEQNAGNLQQTVISLAHELDQLDPLEKARAIEQLFGKFQFARMSALFQNIVEEGSQANRVLELMNLSASELASLSDRELGRVEESAATKFTAAIEKFKTELAPIGEEFLKLATPIIEWATSMLEKFNELGAGGRGFVVGFLGVIGGLAPVLLMVIGLVANLIANIAKGIGLAIKFFQKLTGSSRDLAEQTNYLNSEQIESETVAASLNQTHQTLTQTYTGEAESLVILTEAYRSAIAEMRNFGGPIMTAGGPMARVDGFAKGRKVPGYSSGVIEVPGPKGAGDIIPAMLAPGEAVIPAEMAKRYGALINAMIAGNIPGFMSGRNAPQDQISSIVSGAAPRSQGAMQNFISAEYQRILQLGGQELANEFLVFVQNFVSTTESATKGALQSALQAMNAETEKFRLRAQAEYAKFKAADPADTAFAHTSGGVSVPVTAAAQNIPSLGLEGTAASEQIKVIAQAIPDQIIRFLHGLGITISRVLNDGLSKMGTSLQALLEDVSGRTVDIFGKTVEIAGGSMEAMTPGLQRLKEIFEQKMRGILDSAENGADLLIVDTEQDLERIRSIMGDAFNPEQYVVLETIFAESLSEVDVMGDQLRELFKVAQERLYEMRVSLGTAGRATLAASGPEGAAVAESMGQRSSGALVTGIRQTGLGGSFEEAKRVAESLIEELKNEMSLIGAEAVRSAIVAFQQGARQEGQTASDSKVTTQIGKDHSSGFSTGARSKKDEAVKAGEETVEAVAEGARRGGKGRARTAGPTTPGEPIQFDILNGKVVEASQHAQTFGQRLATSTTKVVSMGNKIGMVGIGLSSLVGMLGRIDGPLGDFASKLFPIISAMTGLSFALRMLNAETILGIGKRIDEAIAAGASAKATQAKTAADTLNAKITKINSDAKTQEVAISRKLTIANNQQAAASAAATRGLAAMTATSMAMGGGQAGTAVGNIAGKGVAAGSLAISKSQRLLNLSMLKLNRGTLVLGRGFGKFGATIGRVASGILGAIRGLVVGIMKLLGPVGLVVAGFALLAGGIFLLTKVINDQSAKVKGLGDAANLSTKKLETLNSILGTNLQRQEFVGVGAVGSGGTGAQVSGGASAAEEVSSIQQQLLESDEFKEDYKGIIAGIKGATDQAATDALTSMAVTLQTAGASDEMIAGIVNAILIEAGKTELVLDFKEISIADATQAADSAVQAYSEAIERSRALTGRHGDGLDALAADPSRFVAGGNNVSGSVGSIGGSATQEAREAAAGSLASAIQNANIQFAQGKITLEEYNQALADVDQSILGLAQEGATGIAEATLLIGTMIQKLEEAGLTGVGKEVESLLQQGTESGIASASAIVQARAADPTGERIQISDDDRAVLDAGAAVSASAAEKAAAEELTERIKDQTVALVENNRVKTEAEDAEERSKAFASELDTQNDALRDQIDTYTNVSEAIKNNTDIENKNALAHKIASDETLRQEFALAQQADAYNKNTNAVDAFVAGLTEQGALQDELAAKQATAGLEIDISTLEKQIETYDSALASASGLVDETEAQAIAYKISADAALQQAFAVAQATDAANGNTDATAALINNLAIEAELRGKIADISGVASGTGRGGGGRSGPEASALDSITKKIKLFGNAQASVTKGWEASMKAILDFANVAGNLGGEFNGLNKQLRGLDLNENLIEMITGMDPDEYEKRKNDLFIFDDKGTIIGMTDKLSQLNDALNTVLIGEFIDAQNQITNSVSNQITAINKLTAAGASYEAAYRAVQNTAFAAAVATATSAAQIKAAANAAMDAQRMMDRMAKRNEEEQRVKGISDAVKQMNKDFSNQAKILDYINRNRSNLREAQIQEILSDKNLAALILEPNINPGALATALDNAAKREQLELSIKKLTITGQEEIFRDGMGKAMDAFSAQTQKIEFEFEAKMKNEKDIIKKAEEQLALLQFELSTYEADLKDIEFQEEEINKAYEKRFDALDQIAQANEDIVRQQQAQLDVADALSRGDIAAAARAVREARVAAGEAAREQERRRLEDAQRAQLGALVSTRGLTRAQAEEMSLEIEKQIFEIERDRLNPAQELVRLAELKKEADIESLTVLEKTRQEYEKMANRIDLAKAGNWKTVEAMQEALDIVEKLVEELGKSKPLPPPPPPPPPPPARSSGGSSKPAPAPPPQTYTVKPGDWLSKIAPAHGISTAALIAANPQIKNPNLIFPGQQINIPKKATGGMIIPKRMAGGGPAYPVRRMAGGSMVKGYPLGGLIPYSSVGGPFPSLGSDTIPAMLTPGEFVIRRPAVREIGVDKLESLNRNATMGGDVYNYSLSVNVKSESNPDQIARTVMDHIKRVDSQRIRGNRY